MIHAQKMDEESVARLIGNKDFERFLVIMQSELDKLHKESDYLPTDREQSVSQGRRQELRELIEFIESVRNRIYQAGSKNISPVSLGI